MEVDVYVIKYWKDGELTHEDRLESFSAAQQIVKDAVDNGGWSLAEIYDDAGDLKYHRASKLRRS